MSVCMYVIAIAKWTLGWLVEAWYAQKEKKIIVQLYFFNLAKSYPLDRF